MQINSNSNIQFGEIYLAPNPSKIIQKALPKLDKNFAQKLVALERKYLKTQYADIFITQDNKVFVKNKSRSNSKRINGFSTLIDNYYNALQYIRIAEESKLIF